MKHKWLWTGLLIFASIGLIFLGGCASRQSTNKLFYDLGRAPENMLDIKAGSAGAVDAIGGALVNFETSTNTYLSLLAPAANAQGLFFGTPTSNVQAGIALNYDTANSLSLRNGGDVRVAIDADGAPTGGALCLNVFKVLSKCTSAVDASGNCTCP